MSDKIFWDLAEVYKNLYSLNENTKQLIEAKVDDKLTRPIEKSDARTERYGGDEPARQVKHWMSRGVKKVRGIKEDTIIEYLIDEGYTNSEESAKIIMQNMSEEWYNYIIEGRDDNKNKNVKELSSDLSSLRSQQKELTSQLIKDPSNTKLQTKLKTLIQQIKNSSTERSTLAGIQGRTSTSPPERKISPEEKMTPEERKAFRDTRSKLPSGTEEERAKRRAAIAERRPSSSGKTPQSSKMNLAPVNTRTREQQRIAKAGEGLVGGKDPSYYDKEGNKVRLISQGESERTYGPGRSARYQQGATGSGERGATPAGSTIDPERQKGPRGTGRRPR